MDAFLVVIVVDTFARKCQRGVVAVVLDVVDAAGVSGFVVAVATTECPNGPESHRIHPEHSDIVRVDSDEFGHSVEIQTLDLIHCFLLGFPAMGPAVPPDIRLLVRPSGLPCWTDA